MLIPTPIYLTVHDFRFKSVAQTPFAESQTFRYGSFRA